MSLSKCQPFGQPCVSVLVPTILFAVCPRLQVGAQHHAHLVSALYFPLHCQNYVTTFVPAIRSTVCPCLGAHNLVYLVSASLSLLYLLSILCPYLCASHLVNRMSLSRCPQSCITCISALVPATMLTLCPRPFVNIHVRLLSPPWCPPSFQFCVPALVSTMMSTLCSRLIANNHVNLVSPS